MDLKMEIIINTVVPSLVTLILTAVILRFLIPVLKSRKMGQKILEIGPRWHKDKEGTPTMGGLAFIVSVTLAALAYGFYFSYTGAEMSALYITCVYALMCGLIGITDDLSKLRNKRNEGLSARQKFLLQLICSALYLVVMRRSGNLDTSVHIPFIGYDLECGWFYYFLALMFLCGFDNAVNLTDGIDGLCGSVTAAVAVFFAAVGIRDGDIGVTLFSVVLIGGCLGFLVYNFHPARVFMGDTGSLFLGGAVTGLAVMSGSELILVVVGIVYLIETLSVMIQVAVYKMCGKRVFLMAPFHHHLEKKGWGEIKITLTSVFLTIAASMIAYFFG